MNAVAKYFSTLKDYPLAFWMLCLHMLVFATSFNMLLPELNSYLSALGREDLIWMNIGLWTIAAGIVRPVSGKIADNISRKSTMFIGVMFSIACCFLYPFFPFVLGFLVLRFFHGFSTGFQPTGATALIADLIPKGKRGEAMGLFGITLTIGFSLGNGIGSPIRSAFDMNGLFIVAGILSAISLLMIFTIKEDKEVIRQNCIEKGYTNVWQKSIPKFDEVIGFEVIRPSIIMFLAAMLFGFYILLMPEVCVNLEIENKGLFFVVNVPVVVVTRFVAGKLTDKYGARKNLIVSFIILMGATIFSIYIDSLEMLVAASIVYGIGAAISSPAIMAWTADLANPIYKGRGMGTMFICLEFGIMIGNYVAQQIYQNDVANIPDVFLLGCGLMLAGIIFLFFAADKKS